jgi:pyruvate/2-oxoglutarate/acetoin dehydrogenase E1 component
MLTISTHRWARGRQVPLPYSKSLEQYALPWAKDVVSAVKAMLA